MANYIKWNPIHISTSIADKPKQRIDADYWNSLWNQVILQGDNNTKGVLLLKTEVEVLVEQFAEMLDTATGIVARATQQTSLAEGHQVKAEEAAVKSEISAKESKQESLLAKSWAVGGTGVRSDENSNNAKHYCSQAQNVASHVDEQVNNIKDLSEQAIRDAAEVAKWKAEVLKIVEGDIVNMSELETLVSELFCKESEGYLDEIIESNVLPKLQIQTITVPTSGWTSDSASGCYRLAIANDVVKASCVVEVNLDLASLEYAGEIGLKAVTDSYNGGFYLYAETIPTTKMIGTVVILGNSSGLDTTVPDSIGTYLTVKEDEQ